MKNTTKFTVVGINNNIAKLQKVGGGWTAFADGAEYIGAVGDVVEVLEKDYVPEGDLAGYQAMSDKYDGATQFGTLCDYQTGSTIRPATQAEWQASREAEKSNIGGGTGVIVVDGKSVYVEGGAELE